MHSERVLEVVFFNARKWKKVEGGYAPVDNQRQSVNFVSDILMKKYLINRSARIVRETVYFKQLTLSL